MGARLFQFRIYLKDKYKVDKAFVFIGYVKEYESIYAMYRKAGFELIFKPTIKIGRREYKGNVDAELIMHASVFEFNNYDEAIIIAGDGDYRVLIEHLVSNSKLRRVFIPNKRKYSNLLQEYQSFLSFLDDIRDKVERK